MLPPARTQEKADPPPTGNLTGHLTPGVPRTLMNPSRFIFPNPTDGCRANRRQPFHTPHKNPSSRRGVEAPKTWSIPAPTSPPGSSLTLTFP